MDKKTLPTQLVWLWFFHYPKLTNDEKEIIEIAVANTPITKRLVAFILWGSMCFSPLVLLVYWKIDIPNNIVIGCVIIVLTILLSFSIASILWAFLLRKSQYICDEVIEKILRDGIPISEIKIKCQK
jgi:hypothetical protein